MKKTDVARIAYELALTIQSLDSIEQIEQLTELFSTYVPVELMQNLKETLCQE